MARTILLKYGVFFWALILLLYTLIFPIPAYAETFNVTNEDELREALSIAGSNGEDDVINIAAGTYSTNGETFIFESDEDFSLTIVGKGAGMTILDGGNMDRVLEINSVSNAAVFISISGLTIQNGFYEDMSGDILKPGGAGILVSSENLTIQDCEFINNNLQTSGRGGGLFAKASSISMINNIFNGNFAVDGGGGSYVSIPYSVSETLYVINNTFTLNSSESNGGGLYILFDAGMTTGGDLNIYNNILYNNNALIDGSDLYLFGNFPVPIVPPGTPDFTYTVNLGTLNLFNNDLSDLSISTTEASCEIINQDSIPRTHVTYICLLDNNQGNNIDADPLFVDAEAGDVTLQADSPCIDAGDPNAPDLPETDIYGKPRGPIPDIGAVEYIEIVDGHGGNGGCALTNSPATSSPAVFIVIPVLILIRRLIKKQRRT